MVTRNWATVTELCKRGHRLPRQLQADTTASVNAARSLPNREESLYLARNFFLYRATHFPFYRLHLSSSTGYTSPLLQATPFLLYRLHLSSSSDETFSLGLPPAYASAAAAVAVAGEAVPLPAHGGDPLPAARQGGPGTHHLRGEDDGQKVCGAHAL
eukprot:1195902-Prorocentrum_minimum.AAC.6